MEKEKETPEQIREKCLNKVLKVLEEYNCKIVPVLTYGGTIMGKEAYLNDIQIVNK